MVTDNWKIHLSFNWFKFISMSHYGALMRPEPWDLEGVKLHPDIVFQQMSWSEMSALVTISSTWGSDVDKSVLVRPQYICRQVLPWCRSWVSGRIDSQNSYHQLLDDQSSKGLYACCPSQLLVKAKMTGWCWVCCEPLGPSCLEQSQLRHDWITYECGDNHSWGSPWTLLYTFFTQNPKEPTGSHRGLKKGSDSLLNTITLWHL